jgi:DNA repair exonuclease SbcCD nuclease subunit
MGIVRVLFLADTHLGFDLAFRPRIERRRRGPEFFANFQRALQPALDGRVDCVVHGGDLLFRSKVPARLVNMAFEPLKQVADSGIPVYLVPGNHERSAIPHGHLGEHPHIHIFDRPRTFRLQKDNVTIALAGFPFVRHGIGRKFINLIDQTGCHRLPADIYLLCIHQSVEGATVGPVGYMFRRSPDVISAGDIPGHFSAVLAGHIHRHQVLTTNLKGKKTLHAPVFYPGSIDRTSFAEKNEKKGYLILEFELEASKGSILRQWQFHKLPVRPMIQLNLHASNLKNAELRSWIETRLSVLPEGSIVRLKIYDSASSQAMKILSAGALRALAPQTMNIDAVFVEEQKLKRYPSTKSNQST